MKTSEFVTAQLDQFQLAAGLKTAADCHPLAVSAHFGGGFAQEAWEPAEMAGATPLVRAAYALGSMELSQRGNSRALGNVNHVLAIGFSTSDFSHHLGELMRISAVEGLSDRAAEVKIAGVIPVPNFKPHSIGALGVDLDLIEQTENGEAQSPGPLVIHDQAGVSGKVDAYAREFLISLQALHADASRKIVDTARNAGAAAGRLRAQLVWGLLKSNPTLGDGGQLFHADYDNLLSAAALSLDSIEEMDAALCRLETSAGNPVANSGKYLAVAPEQRMSAINILHNAGSEIQVVSTPELADGADYYLFADPAINPAVALLHLEGRSDGIAVGPGDKRKEFTSRGVSLNLAYDVGVVAVSRLGVVKRASS